MHSSLKKLSLAVFKSFTSCCSRKNHLLLWVSLVCPRDKGVLSFCTAGQQDKLKQRQLHHVPPCIKKVSKQLCKWIIFKESWRKETVPTRESWSWRLSPYRELDMGQGKQKSLGLVPSIC